MKLREDEFSICVWGSPVAQRLMKSAWEVSGPLSKESSEYLKTLGYKAEVKMLEPQFGAAGGLLWGILEGIPKLIPFLRIFIFLVKVMTDKYARMLIDQSSQSQTHMTIVLSYDSEEEKWLDQWNPSESTGKLSTMLDAGYFLLQYLKDKYPNIIFTTSIQFTFLKGDARRIYLLQPGDDSNLNIARFKRTLVQTSFEKYVEKTFSISHNFFIKRVDLNLKDIGDSRTYYFLLPSMLLNEVHYKYEHLKYKISKREQG